MKSEAKKLAESSGLNLSFSGKEDGKVILQSIPESELVQKGTVINITIGNQ